MVWQIFDKTWWWTDMGEGKREEWRMISGIFAWTTGSVTVPFTEMIKNVEQRDRFGWRKMRILGVHSWQHYAGEICKLCRQFQVGNWIYKSGAQGTEQSCGYGLGSYQDTDGVKKTSFTYCLEIILLESQIYFSHINPITRKSRQRGLTVPARNWVYEFM